MKEPLTCYKKLSCLLLPMFLLSAALLFNYANDVYDRILYTSLRPKPGTKGYHFWQITDPCPIMNVYMFNWTNADEIMNRSVLPNFEEVGPYRFRKTREKIDVVFNDNDTVSYKMREKYEFVEEGSESLFDNIVTVSPIAMTVGYRARFDSQFQKSVLSMFLSTISSITMKRTVKELLFEGYRDSILDAARPFSMVIKENIVEKFAFLKERNSSDNAPAYNVYLGEGKLFGELLQYNYRFTSPIYEGDCALYHGSSGEFYPIHNYNDYIELFVPELCTASRFVFEENVESSGMYARKFTSTHMFDNGEFIETNRCYCPHNGCMPNGVFNVSLCSKNTPMFISSPHFLDADPYYRNIITGMKPDKDKHEFYFYMEPNSGITFKYGLRAQVNMHLMPIEGIGFFENLPNIMVPILYLDETVVISDEVTFLLYLLQNVPNYIQYTYTFLFLLSFVMIVYLTFGICRHIYSLKR